ncbi:DUF536 domain-containing protein [Desulfovibrio sp. UCD-KL4C]
MTLWRDLGILRIKNEQKLIKRQQQLTLNTMN